MMLVKMESDQVKKKKKYILNYTKVKKSTVFDDKKIRRNFLFFN